MKVALLVSVMRAGAALAIRPRLWIPAVRQWKRLVPNGWWRSAPFLPVPDRSYLRFRLQTQYGSPQLKVVSEDLIGYLTWCRDWDRT